MKKIIVAIVAPATAETLLAVVFTCYYCNQFIYDHRSYSFFFLQYLLLLLENATHTDKHTKVPHILLVLCLKNDGVYVVVYVYVWCC